MTKLKKPFIYTEQFCFFLSSKKWAGKERGWGCGGQGHLPALQPRRRKCWALEALMLMFLPPSQWTLWHNGRECQGQHSSPPQWALLMLFTFSDPTWDIAPTSSCTVRLLWGLRGSVVTGWGLLSRLQWPDASQGPVAWMLPFWLGGCIDIQAKLHRSYRVRQTYHQR